MIRIPIVFKDRKLELPGDTPLPDFVDGAEAELVIDANKLADDSEREWWTSKVDVVLVSAETKLFARVHLKNIPSDMLKSALSIPYPTSERRFVRFHPTEDVVVTLSPGSRGTLCDCMCRIPSIGEEALSVGEACRKIARVYEPKRRSDSGNAFDVAHVEKEGRLVSLGRLRYREHQRLFSVRAKT